MKKLALWKQIIIAIILGAIVGLTVPGVVPHITFLGTIFMRLLNMLIAPLVLFTLTSGVCKMGDIKQLRTVGIRIVVYYLVGSAIAAAFGIGAAMISQPGQGVTDLLGSEAAKPVEYNFLDNMVAWIPTNVFESLTNANTLQIIIFALFAGVALLALGERGKHLTQVVDEAADVMLKLTDYVMMYSPIGIFALIAKMVTTLSGKMLVQVAKFILTDVTACLLCIIIMLPLAVQLLSRESAWRFFKNIMPALIVAASTTSSAATLPLELKIAKQDLGVPENIYGFTLPLGNTCNMNGMAIGLGIIGVFASNLYGYPITLTSIIQFTFLGLVLSVGCAGVKGAGIVMSSVLLNTLGMPLTLVPIIAAVFPLIDPLHTAANIGGDLAGTVVVAKSLDKLDQDVFYGRREALED